MYKGGKFINSGVSKCAFTPVFKCADGDDITEYEDNSNFVSTIGYMSNITKDLENNELLSAIDPDGEYTLPILKQCKLHHSFRDEEDIGNCDIFDERGDDKLMNIIYENGGKSVASITASDNTFTIKSILESLPNLFNIFLKLSENNICHIDLHENNILYHKQDKKYYLIDYAGLIEYKDLFYDNPFDEKHPPYHPNDANMSYILLKYIEMFDIDIEDNFDQYSFKYENMTNLFCTKGIKVIMDEKTQEKSELDNNIVAVCKFQEMAYQYNDQIIEINKMKLDYIKHLFNNHGLRETDIVSITPYEFVELCRDKFNVYSFGVILNFLLKEVLQPLLEINSKDMTILKVLEKLGDLATNKNVFIRPDIINTGSILKAILEKYFSLND